MIGKDFVFQRQINVIGKDFVFQRQINGWASLSPADRRRFVDEARQRYFEREGRALVVFATALSWVVLFCFAVVIPVFFQWSMLMLALAIGCAVFLQVAGAELMMSALILKDLESICQEES